MHYKCGDCLNSKAKFSVRTGTILENSPVPLLKWLLAINLMITARKDFSSVQFAKHLGVTQKTAWYMEHRICKACESGTPILQRLSCMVKLRLTKLILGESEPI